MGMRTCTRLCRSCHLALSFLLVFLLRMNKETPTPELTKIQKRHVAGWGSEMVSKCGFLDASITFPAIIPSHLSVRPPELPEEHEGDVEFTVRLRLPCGKFRHPLTSGAGAEGSLWALKELLPSSEPVDVLVFMSPSE